MSAENLPATVRALSVVLAVVLVASALAPVIFAAASLMLFKAGHAQDSTKS